MRELLSLYADGKGQEDKEELTRPFQEDTSNHCAVSPSALCWPKRDFTLNPNAKIGVGNISVP